MRINEDYIDDNSLNEFVDGPLLNNEDDSFKYLDLISDVKLNELEINYNEIIDTNQLCPLSSEMERTSGNIELFSLMGSVFYSVKVDLFEGLKNSTNPVTVINELKEQIVYLAKGSKIPKILANNHYNAEVQIKEYFMLDDFQIKMLKKNDGIVFFNITIPDLPQNRDIISKAMGGFGYFLSKNKIIEKKSRNDINWVKLIYEPNYQPYVTKRIHKLYPYLYHLAPAKYYSTVCYGTI